ncbi:MAG: hypothetical protein QXL10_01370, partial [Candidatus Bathyarchaeia archaeon]
KILFDANAKCYHFNRSTLRSYFRQQLQYGKNTVKLYLKHARLAKGDEITDFVMNMQPFLLLAALSFLLLGIIDVLRPLWLASAAVFGLMLIYYFISAVKLSIRFKDAVAMLLVVLYFVRAFAWFSGAVITTLSLLWERKR